MSILAIAAAIRLRLGNPTDKLVLMMLADRHNADTGDCFPKIATLAENCECSVDTVLRAIRRLEDAGIVRREQTYRTDGTKGANQYHLLFVPTPAFCGGRPLQSAGDDPPQSAGVLNRKDNQTHTSRARTREAPMVPGEDWRPAAEDVAAIQREFPHATDRDIDASIADFISWTNAKQHGYRRLGHAWRQSARRFLARPVTPFRQGERGARGTGAGLSGAIRRRLAGDG